MWASELTGGGEDGGKAAVSEQKVFAAVFQGREEVERGQSLFRKDEDDGRSQFFYGGVFGAPGEVA